jgi:hypothetical protein
LYPDGFGISGMSANLPDAQMVTRRIGQVLLDAQVIFRRLD